MLQELARKIHALGGYAGLSGLTRGFTLAAAIEILVQELREKPELICASVVGTLDQAIDFLGALFQRKSEEIDRDTGLSACVLVVDNERVQRNAVKQSLERVHLKAVSVDDALVGMRLANENDFEVVIADVEMIGMGGIDLCAKLRAMPNHARTPILLLTASANLQNRAQVELAGGNDLIAKPFHGMELAVKTLVFAMKGPVETAA